MPTRGSFRQAKENLQNKCEGAERINIKARPPSKSLSHNSAHHGTKYGCNAHAHSNIAEHTCRALRRKNIPHNCARQYTRYGHSPLNCTPEKESFITLG